MCLWCSPPDLYICIFLCFSGFYCFPCTSFEWPGSFSDTESLLLTWHSKFTVAQINITEVGITYFIPHTKSQAWTTHSLSKAHWHNCTQLRLLTWTNQLNYLAFKHEEILPSYQLLFAEIYDIYYIYEISGGNYFLSPPALALTLQSTWTQHSFTEHCTDLQD